MSAVLILFGPVVFLLLGACHSKLSDQFVAKTIKEYDDGRFLQSIDLRDKGSLGKWSSRIATEESNTVLQKVITTLRFHWTFRYFLVGAAVALMSFVIFYKPIGSSTTEILTGNLRSSLTPPDLPDTLFVDIYNAPNIKVYERLGYQLSGFPLNVVDNSQHHWKYKGRAVKSTWIVCDSIISVNSWTATVHPPTYTGINNYTVSDTIKAINGSKVEVAFKGVLTELLKPSVSRETFDQGYIIINSKIKEIVYHGLGQSYSIPVEVREDLYPIIEVIINSYDSLQLRIIDDFQIKAVYINNERVHNTALAFKWGEENVVRVLVKDNFNQSTFKEIHRPQRNLSQLRTDISNGTSPVFQKFSETREIVRSSQSKESEFDKKNIKSADEKKHELLKDNKEEVLDAKFEKELEELWEIQRLIDALELVSRETNEALDSLINESIEELKDSEKEGVQEELEELKGLDKEGQEREEQAKESAEKLKQLLAESTVDIKIDNIERIKRLLKNSWKTSIIQEVNKSIASGSKYREQRSLIQIQKEISDSLDALLITDPMLGLVLNDVSISIDGAVKELESAILLSKNIQIKTAYMVTALNDLNAVLYDVLESEKMSLASTKKQCKKGKAGKTGKPNKGKEGKKQSPKPGNKEGKTPGKKGEPRKPGEQGAKPGENGKGTKELLKEIDNRLSDSQFPGGSEKREDLERLKREILFGSPRENETQEAFENRLWESLTSEFDKEEQGDKRQSNSGDENTSVKGIEIKALPSNNRVSDLPLPVLKKK